MKKILTIATLIFTFNSFQTYADTLKPQITEKYRLDITANSFRDGESIEVGLILPYLFKFLDNSRHYWSPYFSLGMLTLSNVALKDETELEEEVINLEAIIGISAFAYFYRDFIFQYGKVAIDHIILDDSKFEEDGSSTGILLESGLEFQSSLAKWGLDHSNQSPIGIHMGLRWRFGHKPLEDVQGEPDLIEGISFVIGSRLSF